MRFPDKKKCPVDHSCTMSTPKELCIDCRVVDSYNLAIDHCRGNFEEYELELKAILKRAEQRIDLLLEKTKGGKS